MRALVVDDSKPSRSILARVLRDLRFDCTEAANGLEALETIAEVSARLIVNKAAMKLRPEPLKALVARFAAVTGNAT